VRRPRIFLAVATALVSVTFSAGIRAQGLAPATLGGDSRSDEVTNDIVQVITAKTEPAISKKTKKLLRQAARASEEKPARVARNYVVRRVARVAPRPGFEAHRPSYPSSSPWGYAQNRSGYAQNRWGYAQNRGFGGWF